MQSERVIITTHILGRLTAVLAEDTGNVDLGEFVNLIIEPNVGEDSLQGILLYNWGTAEKLLKRVASTDQSFYRPFYIYVKMLAAKERYAEATALLEEALGKTEGPFYVARLQNTFAQVLQVAGKYEEALAHNSMAIKAKRDEPLNYIMQAETLYLAGHRNKALKALRTAVALMPPGLELRSDFKDILKGKESLDSAFTKPPSAGSIARITIFGGTKLRDTVLSQARKAGLEPLRREERWSPYMKRAG